MLVSAFQELVKPQWRRVLETLKKDGGLPVSELSRRTGTSYMASKSHCEDLTKLGYLQRTRLPRTEVGRPEIIYSLSDRADGLFPQAGIHFTLSLLDDMKRIFGESSPEKLLFQHLQRQQEEWGKLLGKIEGMDKKIAKLVKLREAEGGVGSLIQEPGKPLGWVELHHPLQRLFSAYPRVATMELRMLEEVLGTRLQRSEVDPGPESAARVVFEVE